MFQPTYDETLFIGLVLEGFFYGLYSGIFAMYVQCQASKNDTNKTQNLIFYSICVLYVLSVVLFISDIASTVVQVLFFRIPGELAVYLHISVIEMISFAFCDFIAQSILIYRCWIVWGYNIRVVIIPSILAVTFLIIWLMGNTSIYISEISNVVALSTASWAYSMFLAAPALPLTVNPLVTGLIVFRIFKVFREVKTTSEDQILGTTGGSKLRRLIFILVESGMALFTVQLVRLVNNFMWMTHRASSATTVLSIITGVHNMLIGITPTIILVRTSMGLSFDDEKSTEVAIGSLHFAPNHPTSVPELGSIGDVGQDSRSAGDIGIQ